MPHVTIAHQTLTKIDEMVQADQGSLYRSYLQQVLPNIGDAYRTDEDGHRSHLGASLLGQECARAVWYNFHWAVKSNFEGRIIRLFNRGHLEEGRFIALLLMIGCQVYQQDEEGKQFRISFAEGHAGGSGDGVALMLPDLPEGTPALCEFKTHSEKSFIELAGPLKEWRAYLEDPTRNPFLGKGVREARFEHYVQMQLYMKEMGLAVALYVAINKNTDDLYAELVPLNSTVADQYLTRGETLVWQKEPPEKINKSPGFFKCRFCDYKQVCHQKAAPDKNCRTCRYSTPGMEANWFCTLPEQGKQSTKIILKELQLTGCSHYELANEYR